MRLIPFKKSILIFILIIINLKLYSQKADTLKIEKFSVHAQTTVINQTKPSFSAKYTGTNSLVPEHENTTSLTSTLFMGARLWKGASVFINPEIAGGSGLSQALGVAAAPNGETFRIGDPAPKIYLARLFFRQIFPLTRETTNQPDEFEQLEVFPLTKETEYQSDDINQLAGRMPLKYFSFLIGKISVADFFDQNSFSHDPRTQFMSWALMSNGAWDFPANTRGYTPSIMLEYVTPKNEFRYDMSLVPLVANGPDMNWNISKASSHTFEYTRRYKIKNQPGAIRVLGFFTSTNMGNYRESIALNPSQPNIVDTRKYGRTKYGFGINAEQNITDELGCFLRASWNDGNNETWAFTEIDHSISAGLSISGARWKRENDNLGIAYVVSGISAPHRDYLKAGGKGFMLGDGNLNYTSEHMTELYYSFDLTSKNQIFLTGAYQLLINPGYNLDRHGPVNIFSVRLHARI